MADSNTYSTDNERLAKLFEAAAVSEGTALGELAEILTKAVQSTIPILRRLLISSSVIRLTNYLWE